MRRLRLLRRQPGFSLIEMLILIAIVGFLLALTIPRLTYLIRRSRLETVARETAAAVGRARIEAIRRGVPVVIRPDFTTDELVVFADVNDSAGVPGSDRVFNPQTGANEGATDYQLLRIRMPDKVAFWGPGESSPEGAAAILDLTDLGGGTSEPNGAVLERDGRIRNTGGFHFGDSLGNILQVMISPEATARVQIRKYDPSRTAGPDGTHFYTKGQDDQPWRWIE